MKAEKQEMPPQFILEEEPDHAVELAVFSSRNEKTCQVAILAIPNTTIIGDVIAMAYRQMINSPSFRADSLTMKACLKSGLALDSSLMIKSYEAEIEAASFELYLHNPIKDQYVTPPLTAVPSTEEFAVEVFIHYFDKVTPAFLLKDTHNLNDLIWYGKEQFNLTGDGWYLAPWYPSTGGGVCGRRLRSGLEYHNRLQIVDANGHCYIKRDIQYKRTNWSSDTCRHFAPEDPVKSAPVTDEFDKSNSFEEGLAALSLLALKQENPNCPACFRGGKFKDGSFPVFYCNGCFLYCIPNGPWRGYSSCKCCVEPQWSPEFWKCAVCGANCCDKCGLSDLTLCIKCGKTSD